MSGSNYQNRSLLQQKEKSMTLRVTNQEFYLLRDFIIKKCGINLGEDKSYLIENRLSDLTQDAGCKTFGELYLKLKTASPKGILIGSVIDAITTNETLWFRDISPYQIFSDRILPALDKEINEGKRYSINIWSAACSTGQEPYSIAMKSLDYYRNTSLETQCFQKVRILASDVSISALSQARAGHYSNIAIKRGLPSEYLDHYFKETEKGWAITNKVKRLISFKELNLMDTDYGTLGLFDIIFLRNIIIYFSDTFKKTLLNKIANFLSPGGYLILGSSESLNGYSDDFDMINDQNVIFYKLKSNK